MPPKITPALITQAVRVQTAKDVILEHRQKAGARASYELYGLNYSDNRLKVVRVEHAPTSADFAPMRSKSRVTYYLGIYDMVVEFRGAWKSDEEANVVAYENANA